MEHVLNLADFNVIIQWSVWGSHASVYLMNYQNDEQNIDDPIDNHFGSSL